MKTSLESYGHSREALLTRIIAELSNDKRFVAAWLTGSYGREEADEVSDLDLNLVVAEPYSESLCARQEQVSHRTTPERYALFRKFGTPALIHENNNNAPPGGTFTFVMYEESAVMVDWTLLPLAKAKRADVSQLLFDKANVPVSHPEVEGLEESKRYVAEQWAFFWMMMAVTIKYIHRDDGVFVAEWIEHLHGLIHEIERRVNGQPWSYRRGSLSKLQPTREKQLESIRELCDRVQGLKPRVTKFTGSEPASPLAEIELLLSLANK